MIEQAVNVFISERIFFRFNEDGFIGINFGKVLSMEPPFDVVQWTVEERASEGQLVVRIIKPVVLIGKFRAIVYICGDVGSEEQDRLTVVEGNLNEIGIETTRFAKWSHTLLTNSARCFALEVEFEDYFYAKVLKSFNWVLDTQEIMTPNRAKSGEPSLLFPDPDERPLMSCGCDSHEVSQVIGTNCDKTFRHSTSIHVAWSPVWSSDAPTTIHDSTLFSIFDYTFQIRLFNYQEKNKKTCSLCLRANESLPVDISIFTDVLLEGSESLCEFAMTLKAGCKEVTCQLCPNYLLKNSTTLTLSSVITFPTVFNNFISKKLEIEKVNLRSQLQDYEPLIFKVGDNSFQAPKMILVAKSEYFKTMFKTDCAENSTNEVTFREESVNFKVLAAVVRYLVYDDVDNEALMTNSVDFFDIAVLFGLKEPKQLVVESFDKLSSAERTKILKVIKENDDKDALQNLLTYLNSLPDNVVADQMASNGIDYFSCAECVELDGMKDLVIANFSKLPSSVRTAILDTVVEHEDFVKSLDFGALVTIDPQLCREIVKNVADRFFCRDVSVKHVDALHDYYVSKRLRMNKLFAPEALIADLRGDHLIEALILSDVLRDDETKGCLIKTINDKQNGNSRIPNLRLLTGRFQHLKNALDVPVDFFLPTEPKAQPKPLRRPERVHSGLKPKSDLTKTTPSRPATGRIFDKAVGDLNNVKPRRLPTAKNTRPEPKLSCRQNDWVECKSSEGTAKSMNNVTPPHSSAHKSSDWNECSTSEATLPPLELEAPAWAECTVAKEEVSNANGPNTQHWSHAVETEWQ